MDLVDNAESLLSLTNKVDPSSTPELEDLIQHAAEHPGKVFEIGEEVASLQLDLDKASSDLERVSAEAYVRALEELTPAAGSGGKAPTVDAVKSRAHLDPAIAPAERTYRDLRFKLARTNALLAAMGHRRDMLVSLLDAARRIEVTKV